MKQLVEKMQEKLVAVVHACTARLGTVLLGHYGSGVMVDIVLACRNPRAWRQAPPMRAT